MGTGSSQEDRFAEAEQVLGEWLARRGDGGAEGFETLVGAHPGLARELRELGAFCGEVDSALGAGKRVLAEQQAEVERLLSGLDSPGFTQRYAVEGEVGKGGMGAVYRVVDRKLDRPLAMKVILGQAEASRTGKTPPLAPRQLARFLNEAKITGQLDHPGIVPVHEVGVDHEGRAYFTMKLVKGRTLGEVFEARAANDPEWSTTRVLGVIQRVCEALAFAHDRGVIHRDLKPANVMVGDFGEVYVMDWGLARRLGEKEDSTPAEAAVEEELSAQLTLTREGQLLGTPTYMSPEQASGKLGEIGPAADIYAIGAMLYQLIAGHPPYCGAGEHPSAAAVIARILQGSPKPLVAPETPPELIAICEKALARDPKDRYSSTSALAADLAAFLEGRVVRAYETGAWAEARKWVQRNRALALATGLGLLALVGGLVTSLALKAQSDRNAKLAEDNAMEARAQTLLAQENERRAEAGGRQAREEKERANREAEAARSSEQAALAARDDVLKLSALQDLDDLVARAEKLWPAHPENIERYEAWLQDAKTLADRLPGFEAKLAELRAKSRPWTEADQAALVAAHPKLPVLEAARRHLAYLDQRKAVLSTEPPDTDPTPAAVGVDFATLPTDADSLNSLAWPLVAPERTAFGEEEKGLVLARRAVELASEAELASIRDTLAWALYANARLDDALAEEERVLEECAAEKRAEFEGYLAKLQQAVEAELSAWGIEALDRSLTELESSVAQLEAEVSARPAETWQFDSSEDKWWHNQLVKLVDGLGAFLDPATGLFSEGTSAEHGWGVKKRLTSAVGLRDGFAAEGEHAQAWAKALPEIRAAYPGLVLTPQVGLMPLGPDPSSKLWEFAHLETGTPAVRGADGKLLLTEETGLVFVLLAGGTFQMGAQKGDPNGPNYDPQARSDEGPVHAVKLSAFFLSKYEMTQGQWERFVGSNPSYMDPGSNWGGRVTTRMHPVEQVSWITCMQVMERLRLRLPSEAQWEYGARAGTTTAWWTGNERELLVGAVNLADQAALRFGQTWEDIWPELDDGFVAHAPVDRFVPNAFGLHNVHGNVWEWCLDGYDGGFYRHPGTKDPVSPPEGSDRVIRGGSCTDPAVSARSADRRGNTQSNEVYDLGLRPARTIAP